MKVEGTPAACELIELARRERAGALVITIGTGCCESTAPFLYEDFWPGPDHEQVGEAAGVAIFAPEYLRKLYPGDETLVVDVNADDLGESMSIETEYGCRFTLRAPGEERSADPSRGETSVTPAPAQTPPRPNQRFGRGPRGMDRSGPGREVVGDLLCA